MSNFSAAIPVELLKESNALLEELGFGPSNFSVPAYSSPRATYALLHAWGDPDFEQAVESLQGVTIVRGGDAVAITSQVATDVGTQWAQQARPLEGVVTPGLHRYTDGSMWWVLQQYDTATWPDPYAPGLQALVVPARVPGVATEWVQPLNEFTAYYLVNPFSGTPDEVTHNGQVWYATEGDSAGLNIWEPGVFGWALRE